MIHCIKAADATLQSSITMHAYRETTYVQACSHAIHSSSLARPLAITRARRHVRLHHERAHKPEPLVRAARGSTGVSQPMDDCGPQASCTVGGRQPQRTERVVAVRVEARGHEDQVRAEGLGPLQERFEAPQELRGARAARAGAAPRGALAEAARAKSPSAGAADATRTRFSGDLEIDEHGPARTGDGSRPGGPTTLGGRRGRSCRAA